MIRQDLHDYLEHLAAMGKSATTLKVYRRRLEAFIESSGVRHLGNITPASVQAYHDALIERNLSNASRLAYLTTFRGFCEWAQRHGRVLGDLAATIELPRKVDTLPPTPLTHQDVIRLMNSVSTRTIVGQRNRAILEVLYACGLRAAELLRLNVGDIDFDQGSVFVHGKGDKDRVVPIHDVAVTVVVHYLQHRKHPRRKSPLFVTHPVPRQGVPGASRRLDRNDLDAIFRGINKRFAKHVHPHLLRHTFAVHLLQGGADIRHVQALLGHESPDTTSQYLGLVKDELKRVYDRGIEAILVEDVS